MSERFIKYIPSERAKWLLEKHPNAFLLLTLIATRARLFDNHPDGLKFAECFIGDYKSCGLKTRGEYRYALAILVENKLIEIVDNCHPQQPLNNQNATTSATTRTTTRGTKVKLISSDIYDVNYFVNNHINNHINNHTTTNLQPRTKNKKEKKEEKNINTKKENPKDPEKLTFGHDNLVRLTPEEHAAFVATHGAPALAEMIENLNDYIAQQGRDPYTNHAATLRMWFRREKQNPRPKAAPSATLFEYVSKYFKNGEIYNNAICSLTPQGIAFDRQMTHGEVRFSDKGAREQFENLCRKFGIILKPH